MEDYVERVKNGPNGNSLSVDVSQSSSIGDVAIIATLSLPNREISWLSLAGMIRQSWISRMTMIEHSQFYNNDTCIGDR
jgi:hypothetical protein